MMTRWDRLQALDDALISVHGAIEALRESEDDDDISDMLDDIDLTLTGRRKSVYTDIQAHDDAEREMEYANAHVGVI